MRVVTAIHRTDLFPYGTLNGDSVLAEGDDETSKVLYLPKSLYFYDTRFSQLYVSINDFVFKMINNYQNLPVSVHRCCKN